LARKANFGTNPLPSYRKPAVERAENGCGGTVCGTSRKNAREQAISEVRKRKTDFDSGRAAMTRADSMRYTASMVRWKTRCGSVADTATDHTSFNPWMQERLFVGGLIWQLSSEFYFVLDLLFGQDGCEVFHLKDLGTAQK
jgi:hypothetical protein